MYQLHQVEFTSSAAWEAAIAEYPTAHFYHSGAWLDFIEQTQPVQRVIYEIRHDRHLAGYLPGFTLRRGPIRVFGSPLPGWTTPYLGPVLDRADDVDSLFAAIEIAFRHDRIQHAELRHFGFDCNPPKKGRFRRSLSQTFISRIGRDEDEVLSTFSKSARKSVRRAIRAGLTAQATQDPRFVDVYYDQLRAVFRKSGTEPTYTKQRVQALWDRLMPTGRMLATMVKDGEKCVATRIDFFGCDRLHSFGSASDQESLKLCPNELARYYAMCEAAKRRLAIYDMTGGGSYKAKFNANPVTFPRYVYSSPLLMAARAVARRWTMWKLKRRAA